MTSGAIIFFVISILIYLAFGARILDRLYLSDNQSLFILVLIISGSFINIELIKSPNISLNIGGALIPLLLSFYVLFKINTKKELKRTIFSVVITGILISFINYYFRNFGEGRDIIDPMYLYPLIAGFSAYIFGRSRRGAFISGILGYLLYNLLTVINVYRNNIETELIIGGGGAIDPIIISGFITLLLVEIIGEIRENLNINKEGENN